MQVILEQVGTFVMSAAAMLQAAPPEHSLVWHVGQFLLGSIPTALLFIVLVVAYEFLVQGPLTATLQQRRALTHGAMEEAQKAITQAEARASEYAAKLRQARAELHKVRDQRIKQWNAERDAALEDARKAAGHKVRQVSTELESETAAARQALAASAAELASQAVRAVLPQAAGGSR